jgi:hypothetical protein
MADLPATRQPAELVYRPISGLALAGFVLGCLFTAMVVLSTLVALAQGLPVFLPGWSLGLAAGAAAICFLAQYRIHNAEGTLAGLALARWGLWLSVLLGVSYFVYTWVTGLALAKQADDFLMINSGEDSGFFPRLMNAGKNRTDLYQAFLLSLPTTSRGGSKAANEEAMLSQYNQAGKDGEGNIDKFSRHPLVLAISKNPRIERLSVVDWNYDKNSYHVVRNYRLTTPELVLETPITVQSTEGGGEGEQRKWFVDLSRIPKFQSMKPTPLGDKLLALRYFSKVFLEKWRAELVKERMAVPQYKDTDTDWTKILPKKEPQREHIKKMLAEIFRGDHNIPVQVTFQADDTFADWKVVDSRVQIVHTMKMILPAGNGFRGLNVELEITAATKDPLDLSGPLPLLISWELRKIRAIRALGTSKSG